MARKPRSFGTGRLKLDFTAEAFPASVRFGGNGTLRFSWDDIIAAAVTVGRPPARSLFIHGHASLYEALFRLSLVRMAVTGRRSLPSALWRTNALINLDPTEKGMVTYMLGMVACKLFAEKLLDTPWLLHLDVFRGQLSPGLLEGRSRPDLVGQSVTGDWYAFECKGRSSVPDQGAYEKAKSQAQRLISVDGQNCSLQIGAITYFEPDDQLYFHWRDPVPVSPDVIDPIEMRMEPNFWEHHYGAVAQLLRERPTARDGMAEYLMVDEADFKIAVHAKISDLLKDGNYQLLDQQRLNMAGIFEKAGFRADGLRFKAGRSWARPEPVQN